MIFLILVPLYLLVNCYIIRRSLKWMGNFTKLLTKKWFIIPYLIIYIFASSSMLIAFWLPASPFQRFMKVLSNNWLGTMLFALLFIGIADLGKLIAKHTGLLSKKMIASKQVFAITGSIVMILVIVISTYGVLHAQKLKKTVYEVDIAKDGGKIDQLNVALVADLHLGYNVGVKQVERMVTMINEMQPDIVCIAGDIFDNDYDALDDPERLKQLLRSIQTKYGVYACYGNHDIKESLLAGFQVTHSDKKVSDDRMDQFLADANIRLLNDETILIDESFYLIGRLDYKNPGKTADIRKTPEQLTQNLDKTKPILVMDHEPAELEEMADAGVDVDLSGHTHDGQIFPGNLTIHLFWENAYGYMQKGVMHSIVTSGAGLWGPNMRIGTDAEVVQVRINME
ncbi:putative metallophosphoesterase [Clostridiales bacterium CHKCI001]|nr:putative metallophosphoesterase [Clostridiales bacterium CHKCI001]